MLVAEMRRPLEQPRVDIEDVARIGLAPRRPAEQERQLAVGPGVAGQVVIDDEHVPALLHEVLGHRGRGVGGGELQARRVLAGRDDDDAARHCAVLLEGFDHAGDGRTALTDGAVDADHPVVALVDQGIESDRGLAGLPVAENELALAAADRDRGIDRLDAGLQRLGNGCPRHDRRRRAFDRPAPLLLDRPAIVERPAGRVDHPAEQRLADRHVDHARGAARGVAHAQVAAVAEQHDTDAVDVQVQGDGEEAARQGDQLVLVDVGEAGYPRDAARDMDDRADLGGAKGRLVSVEGAPDRLEGLLGEAVERECGAVAHPSSSSRRSAVTRASSSSTLRSRASR